MAARRSRATGVVTRRDGGQCGDHRRPSTGNGVAHGASDTLLVYPAAHRDRSECARCSRSMRRADHHAISPYIYGVSTFGLDAAYLTRPRHRGHALGRRWHHALQLAGRSEQRRLRLVLHGGRRRHDADARRAGGRDRHARPERRREDVRLRADHPVDRQGEPLGLQLSGVGVRAAAVGESVRASHGSRRDDRLRQRSAHGRQPDLSRRQRHRAHSRREQRRDAEELGDAFSRESSATRARAACASTRSTTSPAAGRTRIATCIRSRPTTRRSRRARCSTRAGSRTRTPPRGSRARRISAGPCTSATHRRTVGSTTRSTICSRCATTSRRTACAFSTTSRSTGIRRRRA